MDKSSQENRRKLVCFHLFNDFSGSPMVLKSNLNGLLRKGERIDLITSRGGVLDSIDHTRLKRQSFSYSFSKNPLITIGKFFYAQIAMMLAASTYAFKKDSVFYINTILPIGPALVGRLTGKKVIYHYHENAFIKSRFYRFLTSCMEKLANEIICVSEYQASFLKRKNNVKVIPNSLESSFKAKLTPNPEKAFERKNVLMISSLKEYKGVKEFIKLAENLKEFNFTLVLNADSPEIFNYIKENEINLPSNCTLFPRTDDTASFYNKSSIALNLSHPDLFIETFGMTVLEAMSAGLPVIVPPVGGVAEMVEDGVTGFKISVKDPELISKTIRDIFSKKEYYLEISKNALKFSEKFDIERAINNIIACLE